LKRILFIILSIIIIFSSMQGICLADDDADCDIPDKPDISWDDDYSDSASSQKVTMTVEVPDGADKIKFYLFADDEVFEKTRSVSSSTDEVSQSFNSLDEAQEVWGYATALDDDGDETDPSEWEHEYIDKVSDDDEDVDTPDEPEIEWEDAGESTNNSQKVTIYAEIPSGADELRYFLICDGTIKESSKTDDEEYTFRSVDYDQMVIAYVKAYDGSDESYMSDTVTLYIGDSGEVSQPMAPGIQWIDKGYDNPSGQEVKMTAIFPSDAEKVRYYLLANGTVMTSALTTASTYTFSNIYDNQTVVGFIRAYDKFDNESEDSNRAQVYIPNRISVNGNETTGTFGEESTSPEGRVINEDVGLSIRDFDYPQIIVNSSFFFTDIDEKDYELNKALQYLYSAGVFENSFKDKFYPDEYMSRAEFLELILKVTNTSYDNMANVYVPFKDVSYSDKYRNAICYAVANSIMSGDESYRFNPDDTITAGTAAKACVKHFAIRRYVYMGEGLIDDYEKHCLDALKSSNIFNSSKEYKVSSKITRGEAAKLVYRILKIKMDA
jgi:hypothetical protein